MDQFCNDSSLLFIDILQVYVGCLNMCTWHMCFKLKGLLYLFQLLRHSKRPLNPCRNPRWVSHKYLRAFLKSLNSFLLVLAQSLFWPNSKLSLPVTIRPESATGPPQGTAASCCWTSHAYSSVVHHQSQTTKFRSQSSWDLILLISGLAAALGLPRPGRKLHHNQPCPPTTGNFHTREEPATNRRWASYHHFHSSGPHHNRRVHSAHVGSTPKSHGSGDQKGVCCQVPYDISHITPLLQDGKA